MGVETPKDVLDVDLVSYEKLMLEDRDEIGKLLSAASSSGLLYLDLRESEAGREILAILPAIYSLTTDYFHQSLEVKKNDFRPTQSPSQDRGYKSSDCDETFEIAHDELAEPQHFPDMIRQQMSAVTQFSRLCHDACMTLLSSLSNALGQPADRAFAMNHHQHRSSDSGLKLISEPSLSKREDVGDNQHTDSGTLTMLFYDKWGLHAKNAQSKDWGFIAPRAGCALFNVADSLQRMSQGRLHSPRHRVTQHADGVESRLYVSYFLRPEHKNDITVAV